ncbi:HAD family hydrolase [Intestinibacillus massiliensis]|uniref:HAD family hydrolase n=1 Tax=Intestinibacillus massiliensis TaxID=1871029 RepID=UPI000B352C1A|nr:HAD family phosphatase [Intestinibacillus massiliensis]
MKLIKGAIFDMDGTVLDSMCVWHQLSQGFLDPYGVRITPEDYAAIEGHTQYQTAEYFARRYPQVPLTAEQMAAGLNDTIAERYARLARPKDGVTGFLERLRGEGVPCCIATLTSRMHAEKALLDRDMLRYFDFLLTIEDIGVSKREPDIYLQAAARMGCAPEDCMVFEDAPYAAETAKKAGFAVCGLAEPAYAAGETLLRSVSDLFIERSFDELAGKLAGKAAG